MINKKVDIIIHLFGFCRMKIITSIKLIPITLVSITLIIIPSYDFISGIDLYSEKRLVEIIVLLSLLFVIAFISDVRKSILHIVFFLGKVNVLLFLLVFFIGFISSINSNSIKYALLDISMYLSIVIFSLYIATIYVSNKKFYTLIFSLIIILSVFFYFVVFFTSLSAAVISRELHSYYDLFPGFLNRRFMNQWQSVFFIILLAIPFILDDISKLTRRVIFLLAVFWWVSIIFSDGRGIMLATFSGVLTSGLLFPHIAKTWWKHVISVIVIGSFAYYLLITSLAYWTGYDSNSISGASRIIASVTSSGRMELWKYALDLVTDNPFLGVGPMHFAWQGYSVVSNAHPHNIVMQFLAEWGIPATLLLLYLAANAFFQWCKKARDLSKENKVNSFLLLGLTGAFISANVLALFSGVWVMPLSQLSLIVIIGWMIGIYVSDINIPPNKSSKIHHIALKSLSLLLICLILYGIFPEVLNLNKWMSNTIQENNIDKYYPRFWLQGFIY